MHLYVIYPVVLGFAVLFLTIGLRIFRRRVLTGVPAQDAPARTAGAMSAVLRTLPIVILWLTGPAWGEIPLTCI
jgi:hypothetical protein